MRRDLLCSFSGRLSFAKNVSLQTNIPEKALESMKKCSVKFFMDFQYMLHAFPGRNYTVLRYANYVL